MKPVIELNEIGKRFGNTVALSNVSFECSPGITGLLGPNGAGKSTLIKILMGLVKQSTGTGSVLGQRIGSQGRAIRSQVGYMPEDDCYISGLTGIGMVQFSANLAGLPFVEGLRRSHEILDFCDVGQERYRMVDTYSTGMRQKIKFAAAIVHDPQVLILDEPTSALDPEERLAMLSRFRVLASEHSRSVLLSTHILPDVQAVCDNILIIAGGSMRVSDSLENLNRTARPALELRVLGNASDARQALTGKGFVVSQMQGNCLNVLTDNRGSASQLWQVCSELGIQVQSLIAAKTSLEEVFISALEDKHADS